VLPFGGKPQEIKAWERDMGLREAIKISAVEQTEFLSRLVRGELPVSSTAIAAVKDITLLEKTQDYELHGKTGWGLAAKAQIGWWVGWVERENKIYPFALNIDMKTDKDAEKRMPIGRECLKVLGKL
jgi:beta-lactamase class D